MNVFRKFWNALDQLAAALGHLAQTTYALSGELRQRAGIEGPPALPVIDQQALPELANGHAEPSGRRARR